MKQRSANVDIARFLAAVIILAFHVDACGANIPNRVWVTGSYYVEFFFLMTGFLTANHFDGKKYSNRIKNSIEYTLKKFIVIWPYTAIITVIHYVAFGLILLADGSWKINDFIYSFLTDFAYDVLLISSGWRMPLVGPLWFVSSMMLVFPLFCILLQIKNRYLILILAFSAWFIPFSLGTGSHMAMLIRAFAGLCIGAVMYEVLYISRDALNKVNKILLTGIELVAFALPAVLTFLNFETNRFFLFCFFVSQLIMFSGLSFTANIKGRFFNYLGRLSLPIYVVQVTVGEIIAAVCSECGDVTKQVLYYACTVVVAAIFMWIIDNSRFVRYFSEKTVSMKE